jgi:hypothetical protein
MSATWSLHRDLAGFILQQVGKLQRTPACCGFSKISQADRLDACPTFTAADFAKAAILG